MKRLALIALLSLLAGCANPVNRATYREYTNIGDTALANRNYSAAEEAYGRALKNAEWGALSPAERSGSLFNLANAKLRLGKFAEAKPLLEQSLQLELSVNVPSHPFVLKRYLALAVACYETMDYEAGLGYLNRFIPNRGDPQFASVLPNLIASYAGWLESVGRASDAEALRNLKP